MNLVEMLLVGAIVEMQERVMAREPPPNDPALFLVDLGDELMGRMGLGAEDWGPWEVVNRNGVLWTVSSPAH